MIFLESKYYKIMEKLFKWAGIINIGESVNDLRWKSTHAFQTVLVDDEVESVQEKTFNCKASTTAVKKMLGYLKVEIKGKIVGNSYYGFYKDEYVDGVKAAEIISKQASEAVENNVDSGDADNVSSSSTGDSIFATSSGMSRTSNWLDVVEWGIRKDHPAFIKNTGRKQDSKKIYLQPGYHALRTIKLVSGEMMTVNLKIKEEDNKPKYVISSEHDEICEESFIISTCLSNFLDKAKAVRTKKNWSGFEFFGMQRTDVQRKLVAELDEHLEGYCPGEISEDDGGDDTNHAQLIKSQPLMKNILNIRKRNAGPTSSLCPKAIKARNEVIHNVVKYVSFGDEKSFVQHLITECPDVIESALELNEDYLCRIISKLNLKTKPKTLNEKDTAEMLIGKADISQRGYGNIRTILAAKSVNIPSYKNVKTYVNELNVGNIAPIHESESNCKCMGYFCTVTETLQMIASCNDLFSKMKFFSIERQNKIRKFLISKDENLYHNFDSHKKTIFLRDTGDNFRAASKYPTEQTSFSVLNIEELITCPYGQFISTLWRGKESRETLRTHVSRIYNELTDLVKYGVDLTVGDEKEHFNIVVISVTDLSFTKEMLGKCQCTHTFGCIHCELNSKEWCSLQPKVGQSQSYKKMIARGEEALEKLGNCPDKGSQIYKKFTSDHFAQWAPVLFKGTIVELTPPCALHMILAHHRYLWKFLHQTVTKRNQTHLIPVALRKIGCTYLAFQIESYHNSKNKSYDGSDTLKMIGNDCKLMEQNIDTFLNVFVEELNQSWNSNKTNSLRSILKLYNAFSDIARDLRATHADETRIESFQRRVEAFVQLFLIQSPKKVVDKMPYLHYLRNHVSDLMKLFMHLFDWGYGYFSTNAGEHLNKRIKQTELSHTNMDTQRFRTIIHILRTKQFKFTASIMSSKKKTSITCSACNQTGHNKRNKSCPMHESHPPIIFDDTDEESGSED
ncbi:uncharacterized protein [Clytia hemisphaerica]|uniref:uncharacterized protein n=3 Tax=Clytia hemisphaerica TaxID=252671 RepID=UPI0034D5633F